MNKVEILAKNLYDNSTVGLNAFHFDGPSWEQLDNSGAKWMNIKTEFMIQAMDIHIKESQC